MNKQLKLFKTSKKVSTLNDFLDFVNKAKQGEIKSSILPSKSMQYHQSRASLMIIFCEAYLLQNGIQPYSFCKRNLTNRQLINVLADDIYNHHINDQSYKHHICHWLNYLRENPNNLNLYRISSSKDNHILITPVTEKDEKTEIRNMINLVNTQSISLF